MPASDDLALLVEAAWEAGEIARRHFGTGPESWEKDQGQGPVTAADLEIDAMLRARLLAARPGYGWLSEESPPLAARGPRSFIVDPIDGTRAFLDGSSGFAHALAVLADGVPVAAVVYLPLAGLCYTAAAGRGAHLNDAPLAVGARKRLDGATALVTRAQLARDFWPGGVPQLERHFRPSLAWRLALVAEGRFDAMLTLRPTWHWDIAAGALLVAEAGGTVSDGTGAALRFGDGQTRAPGIVAANGALHAGLMRLRRAEAG